MSKKILVSGGDIRLYYTFCSLLNKKYDVFYEKCPKMSAEFTDKIKNSDVLIFGVPMTRDSRTLFTPFSEEAVNLSDISEIAGNNKLIIGGKIPKNVFKSKTADLLERDDFAILNAVPTAEGVLEIAMRETDFCITDSRCLVTGFGRIGKVICEKFKALGAKVTATARRESDIALAKTLGFDTMNTSDIKGKALGFDIIINTVPHLIFTDEVLKNIKSNTLIIDTASIPGGVDFKACKDLDIKAILAPSLPGKVAPKTAGEIISETALKILNND